MREKEDIKIDVTVTPKLISFKSFGKDGKKKTVCVYEKDNISLFTELKKHRKIKSKNNQDLYDKLKVLMKIFPHRKTIQVDDYTFCIVLFTVNEDEYKYNYKYRNKNKKNFITYSEYKKDGIDWYELEERVNRIGSESRVYGKINRGNYKTVIKKPIEQSSNEENSIVSLAIDRLNYEFFDIENRSDLTDDKKVEKIQTVFSSICAGVAIQPIPFADIFILTPIQILMGKRIAKIRGYDINDTSISDILKEITGIVGLGVLSQQLAIGAYKTFLPFLGGFTTIPLVYGLTYGIGNVMDYYIYSKIRGNYIDENVVKSIYKDASKKGKLKAKENEGSIKKTKF